MSSQDDSVPRPLFLTHEAFKLMLGGRLLMAPIGNTVGKVLDLGTGCGIWAADLASEYPSAEVVGMDVFPQAKVTAPTNCRFIERDAEMEDWDLDDAKFDIIHIRLVPFKGKEAPSILRRCYDHLKPGGVIELHESCPPYQTDEPPGSADHASKVIEWSKIRAEAAGKTGIVQSISGNMPGAIGEAGFVDVQKQVVKWPLGPWMDDLEMKHLGKVHVELLESVILGLSTELLSKLGMEESQIVDFVAQVKRDLGVGRLYCPVHITWARKPE